MKGSLFCLFIALLSFYPAIAKAGQNTYTGHDGVSVASAVSIAEVEAVRFGNFAVASPGGNDAYIVLDIDGTRTAHNGASTTISLLNGGASDQGAQSPGYYRITGSSAGASLYITFTDHAGTAISSGNPIVLTGPVGSGDFHVDSLNFNLSGTDGTGNYITADGGGNATVRVGATLHTKAGATSYAPGTYRGTYEIMVAY